MGVGEKEEELRAENEQLRRLLAQALEHIAELEAKVQELEQTLADRSSEPPSFVKPSTPKSKDTQQAENKPRRKRAKDQNGARRREQTPTHIVEHRLEHCPECAYPLQHPQLEQTGKRQVIDLPPPQPVQVTEHQLFKSWCPRCSKWYHPSVDLSGQVMGQGRIGVRITSLVAYLRTALRMSVRPIQQYLRTIHNLTISTGEIVELLHRMVAVQPLKAALAAIKAGVCKSKVVHADETGWREKGQNGYVWGFFTLQGERWYEYDKSRAGAVAKRILGGDFAGVLATDFYGGYNELGSEHQRCWSHLLRDLHDLKKAHSTNAITTTTNEEVVAWAKGVRKLYDEAHKLLEEHALGPPTDEEAQKHPAKRRQREAAYKDLVERTHKLGLMYADAQTHHDHPCHVLCKRLLRHEEELFQFVLVPGLSADNNLAERCVRPVVIMRKVCGGSQSAKGSATRMALTSLFSTWRAKGLNPFDQCFALLSHPSHP